MAAPPIPTHPIAATYNDPWPHLFADVKIDIPGVTDAVYKQILFRTFKDFCDKSNIWTEEVPFDVDPKNLLYPVPVSHRGAANRLLIVYDPASASPDKHWVQGGLTMQQPGWIALRYAPSSAVTWNAVYAKVPTDPTNTDKYPDMEPWDWWIVEKYRDCLYYGVLARLQSSPSKPYSNTGLAKFNLQNYRSEMGKARTDALKANVLGGQRWIFPQSFATTARKGWT